MTNYINCYISVSDYDCIIVLQQNPSFYQYP